MDEKKWVSRNCKFAQVLPAETKPDKNEMIRTVFKAMTKDPDTEYAKTDVTRAMAEMGFSPGENPEIVAAVMGMLNRWYQLRGEQRRKDEGGPNVGRIGQPPIPGRGY
jgi:hypothetical protein